MNYLITGAGSGIGRAITVLLAANGHSCFLLGRNENNLKETLALLPENKHKIFLADITNETAIKDLLQHNNDLVIDGIIANAGVGGENIFGENDRWNEIIRSRLGSGNYDCPDCGAIHVRPCGETVWPFLLAFGGDYLQGRTRGNAIVLSGSAWHASHAPCCIDGCIECCGAKTRTYSLHDFGASTDSAERTPECRETPKAASP